MHNLKLVLNKGHILLKSARATHHLITDDIILYLPNIMKDVKCDFECLAKAIDHLVLIEIICTIITKEITHNRHLCEGKTECPINKILRKVGLNYELKLSCKDKKINKKESKKEKIKFSMSDGVPMLIHPPAIGGKIETTSES
jgi:hypothetical protein